MSAQLPSHMLLKLFVVGGDPVLRAKYSDHIAAHNEAIKGPFFDSGFDLFNPVRRVVDSDDFTIMYDLQIRVAAFESVGGDTLIPSLIPSPFYLYPRSSIYKTPMRLANSVGIIDTGYRGNLCALLDKCGPEYFARGCVIDEGARLLQICAPNLRRVHVQLVDSVEDLDATGTQSLSDTRHRRELRAGTNKRGKSGFGSTGK